LQETAQEVFTYLQGSVVISLTLAFVAGFAADKTVASDRRSGVLFFLIIGLLGLFVGEFMLVYSRLEDYLESLSEVRILFDFIAAYLGSFLIAAIIHFVKPT
jgi:uncharacterized membrane protein YeaQ/YmgE (transglycosylase-associated protein family)